MVQAGRQLQELGGGGTLLVLGLRPNVVGPASASLACRKALLRNQGVGSGRLHLQRPSRRSQRLSYSPGPATGGEPLPPGLVCNSGARPHPSMVSLSPAGPSLRVGV